MRSSSGGRPSLAGAGELVAAQAAPVASAPATRPPVANRSVRRFGWGRWGSRVSWGAPGSVVMASGGGFEGGAAGAEDVPLAAVEVDGLTGGLSGLHVAGVGVQRPAVVGQHLTALGIGV